MGLVRFRDRFLIFIRDGRIYTSGGVTAGIDLAMAMVEEGHGRDIALLVARRMLMFLRACLKSSRWPDKMGT